MWTEILQGVIGAIPALYSANKASDTQAEAGRRAIETQQSMFNQGRADLEPWRVAGAGALGYLSQGIQPGGDFVRRFTMADYEADPGYDFRLAEGAKAIERSAAARGMLKSGATLKALSRFGQDYASAEFANAYNRYNQNQTNVYNRLAAVAGTGQTTAQQVGELGANVANRVGEVQQGIGNVRAAATISTGNAYTNALSQALTRNQQRSAMERLEQPAYPGQPNYTGPVTYVEQGA